MTYAVLARKWRPRSFDTLIGQEHVVRTFVHALDGGRLHHAYLFTGTRGVGKTTVARILAKALNCEQGVSARPCGECAACTEIDAGRFIDLIEVDAASRTKVEDTRELLDNVQYTPTRGRYKVYLIDEVHMLSNHSFNALLKTLEEPPPHVVFLLATTDPQRLPVTVLSRCLQFHLKRLPVAQISDYLATVASAEGVEAEPAALAAVARSADGSMRDALSLLDQAIAYGGGRLTTAEVNDMLGTIEARQVIGLAEMLAERDGPGLLACVEALAATAPDYRAVLEELLSLLHRVAVVQAIPEAQADERWDPQVVRALAAAIPPEDVQLYYQIGLLGRRDLPIAPDPRDGLEMVLLRMLAFQVAPAGLEVGSSGTMVPAVNRPQDAPPSPSPATRAAVAPPPPGEPRRGPVADEAAPSVTSPLAAAKEENWEQIVAALRLEGLALQLASHSQLIRREAGRIELALAPAHASLCGAGPEARLREALSSYLGEPVRLTITVAQPQTETPAASQARRERDRLANATQALEQDSLVRSLKEGFDARIVPDSIQPLGTGQ